MDTSPPSGPKSAQEKSSRSLMLVEMAVRCRTRPICSAGGRGGPSGGDTRGGWVSPRSTHRPGAARRPPPPAMLMKRWEKMESWTGSRWVPMGRGDPEPTVMQTSPKRVRLAVQPGSTTMVLQGRADAPAAEGRGAPRATHQLPRVPPAPQGPTSSPRISPAPQESHQFPGVPPAPQCPTSSSASHQLLRVPTSTPGTHQNLEVPTSSPRSPAAPQKSHQLPGVPPAPQGPTSSSGSHQLPKDPPAPQESHQLPGVSSAPQGCTSSSASHQLLGVLTSTLRSF